MAVGDLAGQERGKVSQAVRKEIDQGKEDDGSQDVEDYVGHGDAAGLQAAALKEARRAVEQVPIFDPSMRAIAVSSGQVPLAAQDDGDGGDGGAGLEQGSGH
ncbi:MAG: hypothetical protein ACOX37_05390 [Bacillota bacterium]